MNKQSPDIIPQFCGYSSARLEQLRADLGLRMPLSTLSRCTDYYRNREKKRDPFREELLMLDALTSTHAPLSALSIISLSTNDTFAAETYADMMNKRRELHEPHIDANYPATLAETLGMATAYLQRSGKKSAFSPQKECSLRSFPGIPDLTDGQYAAVGTSGFFLDISDRKKGGIENGDQFILVHRGEMPMWKYRSRIGELTGIPAFTKYVKRMFTVPAGGLLTLLLSLSLPCGICYDLRRLTIGVSMATLSSLVDHFEEYRVLLVPKDRSAEVTDAVKQAGFCPFTFAAAVPGDRTYFILPSDAMISIETSFLRWLLPRAVVEATLPDESVAMSDPIIRTPYFGNNCPYLLSSGAPENRIRMGELVISASYCKTQHTFFRSAVQAMMTPLLELAVSGIDYTDVRMAIGIGVPANCDERGVSETLSVILGIYRMQAELGIPAAALAIEEISGIRHPELTVFAFGKGDILPALPVRSGNGIYCVAPALSENGLPEFPALRQLLSGLAKTAREQKIAGASVVCGDQVTDVLRSSKNGLKIRISDPLVWTGNMPSLAVLAEGNDLSFARIGTVSGDAETMNRLQQIPDLSSRTLTSCGTCEITVFAAPDDAGARILADELRKKGAECHFADGSEPMAVLARFVLTSQLLCICGNATFPENDQTKFALQTLQAAGGRVLCLGKNAIRPKSVSAVYLPEGIPTASLSKLFS